MNKPVEEKKMTLEEYKEKYNKPHNIKAAKTFLFIFTACLGIIIFCCLFFIVLKLFDIHKIAGYVGIGVATLVFVFVYIVPVVKIKKIKPFMTYVSENNVKEAKKFNKELRSNIADKMIDIHSKTDGLGWYSDESIGKIALARQTKNDNSLKLALTNIYNRDIKSASNKIISDHAVKIGVLTALSQSNILDTMFVTVYELNLVKDIVYLYGYRPNDAELLKIYRNVIVNALIAYGVQSVTSNLATGVVRKIGDIASRMPFLASAIGAIINSGSQAVINASLTVIIGFQTKKYLKKEYKLQDILDDIELDEETEKEAEVKLLGEVKEDIAKVSKNKKDKTSEN